MLVLFTSGWFNLLWITSVDSEMIWAEESLILSLKKVVDEPKPETASLSIALNILKLATILGVMSNCHSSLYSSTLINFWTLKGDPEYFLTRSIISLMSSGIINSSINVRRLTCFSGNSTIPSCGFWRTEDDFKDSTLLTNISFLQSSLFKEFLV